MIEGVSKPEFYLGNITAGCYVYSNNRSPRWVIVNVDQAKTTYPNVETDEAIQTLAKDIFSFMSQMDKRCDKEVKTAFTGYD